jgi:hypothetical protein
MKVKMTEETLTFAKRDNLSLQREVHFLKKQLIEIREKVANLNIAFLAFDKGSKWE